MKNRLIYGTIYMLIITGVYCLKLFLPIYGDLCFDALIYAFALIGSFEMLRAVKDKTTKAERIITFIFACVTIPACALAEFFEILPFGSGVLAVGACGCLYAVALLSLLITDNENTTLEGLGLSLFSALYPTLLLCVLTLANHAQGITGLEKFGFDSRLFVLLVFVISPTSDSIAFVFGCGLKKYFPKKLAPSLSPNKTVIGGIGGIVGGMLGATVVYFGYAILMYGSLDQMYIWLPVFLLIGGVASVATELGDLAESSIKRKVGLKDMGKIMPGHGGILDRIDGCLFSTIVIYGAFTLIRLIA